MNIDVSTDVNEDSQESSFMNATLQGFGERHAISIAVTLPEGIAAGTDPDDAQAVASLLEELFSSAIARGCMVEAQVGLSRDAMAEAD